MTNDESGVAALDTEVLEQLLLQHQELDAVHLAVGRFLAKFNEAFGQVGLLLACYFRPSWRADSQRAEFHSWFGGRLTDTAKIDVVHDVGRSIDLRDAVDPIVSEMRALNSYRNTVAHSSIGPDMTTPTDQLIAHLHHLSMTRRGPKAVRVDVDELNAAARRAELLHDQLLALILTLVSLDRDDHDGLTPRDWFDLHTGVVRHRPYQPSRAHISAELASRGAWRHLDGEGLMNG